MTTIILPDRRLIRDPDIVEYPNTPIFDADGAVVREDGEFKIILCYIEGDDIFAPVHRNLVIRMRHAGFDRSLLRAAAEFLPKLGGGLLLPGMVVLH